MLSFETFDRISKLTDILEQEDKEENRATQEEQNYLNIFGDYNLIKVNEQNTSNYHFELQKTK